MKTLVAVSFLTMTLACNHSPSNRADEPVMADAAPLGEALTMKSTPDMLREEAPRPTPEKKNIKTGGITFQTKDLEADYQKISSLLPGYEAYIENENQSKNERRLSYDLTVRVPAEKFDTLYATIAGLAWRLDNKYSNLQDVTERYFDLQTRIKNKQALEIRYRELLGKASEVKDLLEIERQINQIRTEIESLQGQFNYLSQQVSMSTLQLSFYEELPYVYQDTQRRGFGARILGALDNGWQGFLFFLVGLVTLWPFLLLVGIGIFLFIFLRRRWKQKK